MNGMALLQIAFFLSVLLLLVKPLGSYMAGVYAGRRGPLDFVLGPVERAFYRLSGVDPAAEMSWRQYAWALLAFNALGFLVLYLMLRWQRCCRSTRRASARWARIPPSTSPSASSTNTNWQNYAGETTLSYLVQMVGLTVQNFVSAATGMAVLAALARGIIRKNADTIGNFWVDLVRTTLYVLLPLAASGVADYLSRKAWYRACADISR